MKPIMILPAYKPDDLMLDMLKELKSSGFTDLVIVDDGSGEEYLPVFEKAKKAFGATVLSHAINLGKGRAIKTAFNHILDNYPGRGAIICDADGQHPVESVLAVAEAMEKYPGCFIMAVRNFFKVKVPLPNLLGNTITRITFFLLCGIWFSDTQCGLRGYPPGIMKAFLSVKGERYEYENTTLLAMRARRIETYEVPMNAVYIRGNASSHFDKLWDSARIYQSLLSFARIPILASTVCIVLFYILLLALPLAAPLCAIVSAGSACLAGWLFQVLVVRNKWLGMTAALLISAAFAGAMALLHGLAGINPSGSFWIASVPFAFISYTTLMLLRYRGRPKLHKPYKKHCKG